MSTDVSIEFTRTRGWEARDRGDDDLDTFGSFLRWAHRVALVGSANAKRLSALAEARPEAAARALVRARRLRGNVYRLLCAVARGVPLDPSALRRFNAVLTAGGRWREVRIRSGSPVLDWGVGANERLDFIAWAVARAAAGLIADPVRRSRVRLCDSHDCGWLFLDESRNRSRRWCSMDGCGNVEKARRFRSR
jgi:predicted RNA-binding Zn ribbon-like protein